MNDLYTHYLWKFDKGTPSFRFFPKEELPEAGFQSVYAITESDAESLVKAGTYAGFRGTVWSDRLFIDCDTNENSTEVESRLNALGLSYEKYTTGNRGCHFEVPRTCTPSHLLPSIDKQWCANNLVGADLKLYSQLHLFRRIGHVHEKTGRKKELLYAREGTTLDLTGHSLEVSKLTPTQTKQASSYGSVFEDQRVMDLTVPYEDGNRHKMLMVLAMRLHERGEAFEFALGWVQHVNLLGSPLAANEVERLVTWVYFKRSVEVVDERNSECG